MDKVLIISGIIFAIAAIIIVVRYYSRKRTEALQAASASLGFSFTKTTDGTLLQSLTPFHLFSRGHSKKIWNVMTGSDNGVDVKIFDYRYTTGGGKSSHTARQTVLLFRSNMKLPFFTLQPENVFHKIGKIFGYQDIDWDSYPEFSKQYLVRSSDEPACREIFSKDVIEYYEQRKGIYTEAGNDILLYYRSHKTVRPEDIRDFLKNGFQLFSILNAGKSSTS